MVTASDPLNIVHLIDSPGHVDFSGEVEAALRVCDGALLVVDIVEGVCVQTVTVLRAALEHAVRPVLVLNKIDRLFAELHLSPMEAYRHIQNVLEQVNVIMGVREVEEMMAAASLREDDSEDASEWTLEEGTDALRTVSGYFSPEMGNVVFASATDGWACRLTDFAKLFSNKFGISEKVLTRTLWGDYYLNSKTKRIVRKNPRDVRASAKPMFVQFVLASIYAVYDDVLSTQHDLTLAVQKREKIASKLGLKVSARDLKHRDAHIALHAIMHAWLPASSTLLETVIGKLPSAALAQAETSRLNVLWPHAGRVEALQGSRAGTEQNHVSMDTAMSFTSQLDAIRQSKSASNVPLLAIVSKMVEGVDRSVSSGTRMNIRMPKPRAEMEALKAATGLAPSKDSLDDSAKADGEGMNMVAFARVFSGTLNVGDKVFVYAPRYQVADDGSYDASLASEATITGLFLLMGRDMEPLKSASAGSIVGIAGLEDVVLKTATISSERPGRCLPVGLNVSSSLGLDRDTVVRVAVEPHLPSDVGKLQDGLRKLNQADPAVETFITAKGEHVVAASGELHLERCLKDLRERFAKDIRIHVSKPIVSFRETVFGGISQHTDVLASSTDRKALATSLDSDASKEGAVDATIATAPKDLVDETQRARDVTANWQVGTIEDEKLAGDSHSAVIRHGRLFRVGNDNCSFRVTAAPIPSHLAAALDNAGASMRGATIAQKGTTDEACDAFRESFIAALRLDAAEAATRKLSAKAFEKHWVTHIFPRVWSCGPRGFGSNLLIGSHQSTNTSSSMQRMFEGETHSDDVSDATAISRTIRELEKSIVSGFQLGVQAGPLCEEPMHGVAIFVDALSFSGKGVHWVDLKMNGARNGTESLTCDNENDPRTVDRDTSLLSASLSGLVIGSMRETTRLAFMHGNPRLMEAMLRVEIAVPGDALGGTYTVLAKRRGRVLSEDMKEGVNVFGIEAVIPVIESFGFADALRKQTSGFAAPQMIFSHWEAVEIDPFWVPRTEEEIEDLGLSDATAENNNLARKLINSVRRRKGLRVEEKIVENAEKQRTLSRKK